MLQAYEDGDGIYVIFGRTLNRIILKLLLFHIQKPHARIKQQPQPAAR